jgi:hypothetical protein
MDRHVEGNQGDLTSYLGNRQTVLLRMVEDEKKFPVSDNFSDVLIMKRSVFEFHSLENEQISILFGDVFPVMGADQVIVVGNGYEIVSEFFIDIQNLLGEIGSIGINRVGMQISFQVGHFLNPSLGHFRKISKVAVFPWRFLPGSLAIYINFSTR